MKRSVLINLICSMIVTVIIIIGVMLTLVLTGKLDTEKNTLVLSSASATAIYDGKTLSDNRWYLTSGELKEGHKISASVTGAQTSVGMSKNYIRATIQDADGNDVTEEYTIEYRSGALQVKARELLLVADSAMKLYDGTPLTCNSYTIQSTVALIPTDHLNVTVEGSIVEKGEALNQITSATVTNDDGEDVTRNYSIQSKNGKLVIYDENTLVIKSGDASKVYDGKPLTCKEYTIENGMLKPGHTLDVSFTGTLLTLGYAENTFNVKVVDENGNDVTHMYEIIQDPGTLIVQKADLTIQGLDAQGPYGSTLLTNTDYTNSELPDDHTLEIPPEAFLGEIPAFGSGEVLNTIDKSQIKVLNAEGEDVTEYFNISTVDGNLNVPAPEGENEFEVFRVKTNAAKGTIYLKQHSYGNYNVETKRWEDAVAYPSGGALTSPYYLTVKAWQNSLVSTSRVTITRLEGNQVFVLPYYSTDADVTLTQYDDVRMAYYEDEENPPVTYSLDYYSGNTYAGRAVPDSLNAYENLYAAYVKANYLAVDEGTKAFMLQYAQTNGLNASVDSVATHLRDYWRSGLSYNMKYNRAVDTADNPVIAFLDEYKQGVCRHYAQAATLLYRSLGIPARYTVGFVGENTTPNQEFTITNKQAHAWVEVYVDGMGWVYVEVTGSTRSPINLTATPAASEAQYRSGSLQTPTNKANIVGVKDADKSSWNHITNENGLGYTYEVEIALNGIGAVPGKYQTTIAGLIIYNGAGQPVYEYDCGVIYQYQYSSEGEQTTYKYEGNRVYIEIDGVFFECDEDKKPIQDFVITYKTGEFHIYRTKIHITSQSFDVKTYGEAWSSDELTCQITCDDPEKANYTNVGYVQNAFTKYGQNDNAFTVTVWNGTENVTDEYKIVSDWGSVYIEKRVITLTAGSAEKNYDGTPLTCNEYDITGGTLASGDQITVVEFEESNVVNKYQTADNVITSVIILNAGGADVSSCYEVRKVNGTLTVN